MQPIVVGVPANFFSDIHSHGISNRYLETLVTHSHAIPMIIPCLATMASGDGFSAAAIVAQLDGLLLTGSRSNVHPSRYGAAVDPKVTLFDEARDATTLPLIHAAIEAGVPIFGICRGAQELNCAFGGTLHQLVHELPGNLDHRAVQDLPQHLKYFPAHDIEPAPGGWLETTLRQRGFDLDDLKINSLHGQAIAEPGVGIAVEARAPDGVIEAISVPDAPAWTFAVQWHPEWHTEEVPINKLLFEAFATACASRQEARLAQFFVNPQQERNGSRAASAAM
ncbi:hypothetical protein ASD44_15740 [Mesorhizobium sp. Root554]|uniref:gamma-glutamyl-gamma-aminobutyrate hydrolase family protein n=1 Tax=unclassified Mesorhizobium TaxID=325217 RepID=UPI0006FE31EF|nr:MULTISPECIES: gamma-glutamyl-gamma-aminobutyrate hydrolase family protein [unclassified Mesorhizobium]KQZ15349.1 hypothetical protein ASD27_15745 [Mesorhizobium sp. Root1471]KQZ37857.1 hypothetical protein ASD44_15740 [Mesorhizobium sp. Root554]